MNPSRHYRILLAVDPTEVNLRPSESNLYWFKKWASERNAWVEAVYVNSVDSSHSEHILTESELSAFVNETLPLGKEIESKVLVDPKGTRQSAIDTLLHHSEHTHSDLIVVASHGRSGPGRLVLGSFAEKLLEGSHQPILFLSKEKKLRVLSNKVLFPIDLSDACLLSLELFLDLMEGYPGEIILFYGLPSPDAIYDSGLVGIPVYLPENGWIEEKQWVDYECEILLERVRSRGFKARVVIQNGVLNAASAIQHIAEVENVDLVAMSSVTKEVFRLKKWPVWVAGPETQFGRNS